jgi:hypothetical protein
MTFLFADSCVHYSTNASKYEKVGTVPATVTVANGGNGRRALSWSGAGWGLRLTQDMLRQHGLWPTLGSALFFGATMVMSAPSANLQLVRNGDIYLLLTAAMRLEVWYKAWDAVNKVLLSAPAATIPGNCYIEFAVGRLPFGSDPYACAVMVNEVQYVAFQDTHCIAGDVYLGPEGQTAGSVTGVSLTMEQIYVADSNGNPYPGTQTTGFAGHVNVLYIRGNADTSGFNLEWNHTGAGAHYADVDDLLDPDGSDYIYRANEAFPHGDRAEVYWTENVPLSRPNPNYIQVVYAGTPADATNALTHPLVLVGGVYIENGLGGSGRAYGFRQPVPTSNTETWQYYWNSPAQYVNGQGYSGGPEEKDFWNGNTYQDPSTGLHLKGVIGMLVEAESTVKGAFQVAQLGAELAYRGNPGSYSFVPPVTVTKANWAAVVGA